MRYRNGQWTYTTGGNPGRAWWARSIFMALVVAGLVWISFPPEPEPVAVATVAVATPVDINLQTGELTLDGHMFVAGLLCTSLMLVAIVGWAVVWLVAKLL